MRSLRTPRWTHGFTLIEMLVTVAIIGILATLAGTALLYGTGRARLNDTVFQAAALFPLAREHARTTGHYTYLVFWEAGTGFGAYVEDTGDQRLAAADLASIQAGNPSALSSDPLGVTGGVIVDRQPLSDFGGVAFYPLASYAASLDGGTLPAPFSGASLTPSGTGLAGACSFCNAAAGGTVGVVEFAPNGTSLLPSQPTAADGALAFVNQGAGEGAIPKVLVVATPGGLSKVF